MGCTTHFYLTTRQNDEATYLQNRRECSSSRSPGVTASRWHQKGASTGCVPGPLKIFMAHYYSSVLKLLQCNTWLTYVKIGYSIHVLCIWKRQLKSINGILHFNTRLSPRCPLGCHVKRTLIWWWTFIDQKVVEPASVSDCAESVVQLV